jgi:hypothetical protein
VLSLANILFRELKEVAAKSGLPETVDRANLETGERAVSSLLEQISRNVGMSAMTTLFRPVGLHELALIWDSGMREFPPRLPHQPIFYPVAKMEYATQIARDWKTPASRGR